MKLTSFHTNKATVIAFDNSFHGRTSACVAATDNPKIVAPLNAQQQVRFLPLGDLELVEKYNIPHRRLNCLLYQRSNDFFLGVPFNIASYALLSMMVAQVCQLRPGEFVWTGGDTHLYSNHMEQVETQLTRSPRPLPTMHINPAKKDILDFAYEDFTLEGYDPHPAIKAPVAV